MIIIIVSDNNLPKETVGKIQECFDHIYVTGQNSTEDN